MIGAGELVCQCIRLPDGKKRRVLSVCQKMAEERRGGRRRHGETPSKKTWERWVLVGMEPTRSSE